MSSSPPVTGIPSNNSTEAINQALLSTAVQQELSELPASQQANLNAVYVTADQHSYSANNSSLVVLEPGSHLNNFSSNEDVVIAAGGGTFLKLDDSTNNGQPVGYTIVSGSGNNTYTLSKGPDEVVSTTGFDRVISRGGMDTLEGGTGTDTLIGGGRSFITAGTSGDSIVGGPSKHSHDTITAGVGADTIVLHHGQNLATGTTGQTWIQGGDGFDTISGGVGAESLFGGGTTLILAGDGNLISTKGNDSVLGGSGSDTIFSTGEKKGDGQAILGGTGDLTVNVSGSANDSIFGAQHHDITVNLDSTFGNIASEHKNHGITTIHFSSGQTLEVKHVTINLASDGSTKSF